MAGIYIHIPFCNQACHYCDFHFSTQLGKKEAMVEAIRAELALRKSYIAEPIETLYFGGGTPSILSRNELLSLIKRIQGVFNTNDLAEITLEANPEDLSATKLKELQSIGINRLSIGVQSFNDDFLKFFNRSHDAKSAVDCLRNAKDLGFDNITADIIFGIPGQTLAQLQADLKQLIDIGIPHVSIYGMTIEENTVFGKWLKNGQLKPLEEEDSAEQFKWLMDFLGDQGYEQYEISNFAIPEFRSKHNSSYWQGKKYLGVGPSAHSFDGQTRQYNVRNNVKYLESMSQGFPSFEIETLSRIDKINEALLIQIRLAEGIDVNVLNTDLDFDLLSERNEQIQKWINTGHMELKNDYLQLTQTGKLIADHITEELVLI